MTEHIDKERLDCPNCPNQGWYAVGSNEEGWEQVQCEFCYTEPNSAFNHIVQPPTKR